MDMITSKEAVGKCSQLAEVLESFGFDTNNIKDYACPAFLFEPATKEEAIKGCPEYFLWNKQRPIIRFFICGWNMLQGPFNRVDWRDEEFECYVNLLCHMIHKYDVEICLMSHSTLFNGTVNLCLIPVKLCLIPAPLNFVDYLLGFPLLDSILCI